MVWLNEYEDMGMLGRGADMMMGIGGFGRGFGCHARSSRGGGLRERYYLQVVCMEYGNMMAPSSIFGNIHGLKRKKKKKTRTKHVCRGLNLTKASKLWIWTKTKKTSRRIGE